MTEKIPQRIYSAAEAAAELGITPTQLRRQIRAGRITPIRTRPVVIDHAAIAAYRAQQPQNRTNPRTGRAYGKRGRKPAIGT